MKRLVSMIIPTMRRNSAMKKDLLIIAFVAVLLVVVLSGTKIQSVDEYYLTHIDDITEESETVTISIRCDTVLQNWEKLDDSLKSEGYIPEDGVILEETEYVLRLGDTVFDILNRVTRYNKIQMEYQGANQNAFQSVYIQGIHYLYEYSCGPLSGWMYRVNGEYPNYGCSKYILKDQDCIEFVYTCDLGRDIGGGFDREDEEEK